MVLEAVGDSWGICDEVYVMGGSICVYFLYCYRSRVSSVTEKGSIQYYVAGALRKKLDNI